MSEWLGISHLFELSRTEAFAECFTPLVIFAVFFLAQIILPRRRVTGYVINPENGEPRSYRLNGILVFAIALIVWALELTGMPRDWFYRSSIYAVAGGTVFTAIFTVLAVFSQPRGQTTNPIAALWTGRVQELSFFNNRFDVKMYFYVVGRTMLALNALSGAAYHYERFGEDANPGIYLYAAFFTFYILDYFIFERVQLYTFDLIHENLGFKLLWGGLVVYGWMFILPLWGMAAYPDPGFSTAWTYVWLIGTAALFLLAWSISRGANLQKYTFKRWPDRKILYSGLWRVARHFNYVGEEFLSLSIALAFGHFTNPWAWTYFVFIVTLVTFRQRDDDMLCAEKYGADKWTEYQARVKYRIVPGVY